MIKKLLRGIPIFILISLVTSNFLLAQKHAFHISGDVTNEQQQPLTSATVALLDLKNKVVIRTLSDSLGHFDVSYAVSGRFSLVISYIKCRPYRSPVFEIADQNLGRIRLFPEAASLKEIEIQASQNPIEFNGGNIVYNVSKSITAQGSNAFDELKRAPGVYIDNNNNISLNGKQGALILLDGKQTYLSGKDLTDLLKSMPASGIKSIEIMNSPTAKYDAAGSAGIISIKTNNSKLRGFNGIINTGLSYGQKLKQNEDLSFNYRNGKFNIYGNYNHFLGDYIYQYGTDRLQKGIAYASNTYDIDARKKLGSRIGIDYNLNAKNTIGFVLNSNFVFGGGSTATTTDINTPPSTQLQEVLTSYNNYYAQHTERYNVNLNYNHEDTLGHIFNFDLDYGTFNKSNGNLQSNIYTDVNNIILNNNLYRTLNDININLVGFKLDYSTPLWKGKLETGGKYSAIRTNNDSRFFHVLANRDSLDEQRSNIFNYNEKITSGYISYKKAFGKWSLEAGLRIENTTSNGRLNLTHSGIDSTQTIRRNYTNLFPSLSLSEKSSENVNLSIAYSRRIDRPAYQDLNPFTYLLDELSFWQGNPYLQPQLTHRILLQYAYKNTTIIGLSYAHTDQYSAYITDTVQNNKIVMITKNLGVQNYFSLTATQNFSPVSWWQMTFNGVLYQIHNDVAFDAYRFLNLKQVSARMNFLQSFKLPYQFRGELTSIISSKTLNGANSISNGITQIDIGLQKIFSNKRATLRLACSDIFKGAQSSSVQSFNGFFIHGYGYYDSRQIRLNFTYKFADSSLKDPRNRNSALDNENRRIK